MARKQPSDFSVELGDWLITVKRDASGFKYSVMQKYSDLDPKKGHQPTRQRAYHTALKHVPPEVVLANWEKLPYVHGE